MPEYNIERTWFVINGELWSVVHGHGSYGGWHLDSNDAGLLELMARCINNGDPVGWKTADELLVEVKKHAAD